MTRTTTLLLVALGAVYAVTVQAGSTALADRDWQEVRSEHFSIKSLLDKSETVELLRHLEIMHASLGSTDDASANAAQVPTVILAVDSHEDYVSIGAPDFSAGYFFSDMRENAILIEHTGGSRGIQIILHEYAHYLNKQSGKVRFPRWFEEGNAEYLSHSRVNRQAFEYGIPPAGHLATLGFARWLPLSALLSTDDASALSDDDAALFYAQSWLLVHYLRSLPDSDLTIDARLSHYAQLASAGTLPGAAFAQAFAVDLEDFEEALLQYYLNKNFSSRIVPVNTALPGFSPRATRLSRAETQLALARMALRFDNLDGAERWFTAVLGDNDLRAHAEAGLGRIQGRRGDLDGANEHFENAIYLMAWDFRIWMDYAQYWAQRLATAADYKIERQIGIALVEALQSALTIDDATPELNSLMGLALLAKGNDILGAIDYLETAIEAAPHDQATRMLLARAYLYAYQPGMAIDTARSILRFEHEANPLTVAAHEVIDDAHDLRRQLN